MVRPALPFHPPTYQLTLLLLTTALSLSLSLSLPLLCFPSSTSALQGKSHCLPHHKEQSTYTYGLDHDIQQRLAAKLDPHKSQLCLDWLSALTKTPLPADLHTALKSGTVLCNAINTLFPNSVPRINPGSMPFVQRENLAAYISACKAAGIRETDCFMSDDLYEQKNLVAVIDNLCALGQLAQAKKINAPVLAVSHGAVVGPTGAAPVKGPVSLVEPKHVAPPAGAGQGAVGAGGKFCGGCGGKRVGEQKFCGECGKGF